MQTIAREATRRLKVGNLLKSSDFPNVNKLADKWRWRHAATKLLLYKGLKFLLEKKNTHNWLNLIPEK